MQDILGSIEVGMENNSTCLAGEGRALPLSSIQIPAGGACSGSILSPDELNGNPGFLPFIEKKLLKLVESPVGKQPILFSPMPCFPNAFEFFQNHYSVFSYTIYQSSADNMVDITHKPLLPAPHLAKMPAGRTSAFALQPASQTYVFLLDRKNVSAIIEPSVRRGYKIIDAPVHSQNLSFFIGFGSGLLYGNHQAKFSISALDEIAFPGIPISISLEIFRDGECKLDSALFSQKACYSFVQVDSAASRVIMDGSSREFRLPASFLLQCSFDSGTSIFVGDNCKLSWKAETFSENCIIDMVHPERVGFLMLIAGRNSEILSFSHPSHIFIKYSSLLRSFFNNRLNGFHHHLNINTEILKTLRFLQRLKSLVSSQGIS